MSDKGHPTQLSSAFFMDSVVTLLLLEPCLLRLQVTLDISDQLYLMASDYRV
jgi:hypothetical protein